MPYCMKCNGTISADAVHNYIENMGPEINSILSMTFEAELLTESSELCEDCFAEVTNHVSKLRDNKKDVKFDPRNVPPSNPNLCVWCRLSLCNRETHSIRGAVRSFIKRYIHPRQIPPGGLVCLACWIYARKLMKSENAEVKDDPCDQEDDAVDFNRCVCCSRSLASKNMRRQSLPEGPEREEIAARIYPRMIPEGGRVCYKCWMSAKRHVKRQRDASYQTDDTRAIKWITIRGVKRPYKKVTQHLPKSAKKDDCN